MRPPAGPGRLGAGVFCCWTPTLALSSARITAPTLLVCGDDDPFPADDQQVLLDAIPNARLSLYTGAGHGVHLAQPARVVNDIVVFLADTTPST